MSEDSHVASTGAPRSDPPCAQCDRLRSDVDRLVALVLEIRAERQQARSASDAACLERDAFRSQLADARSALARIRNVATADASPSTRQQRLDWCAGEAVRALDRAAPSAALPGASDAPVAPCPHCDALRSQLAAAHAALQFARAVLETVRPCLKHAAVDGSPDALAALDLLAQALDPGPASS